LFFKYTLQTKEENRKPQKGQERGVLLLDILSSIIDCRSLGWGGGSLIEAAWKEDWRLVLHKISSCLICFCKWGELPPCWMQTGCKAATDG
jgi:hypothetical protein